METRVAEVADGIHQLQTYIPEPNLGFNQFLIAGDEPMLFHTGMRGLFPMVSAAAAQVVPLESLRWIAFGHFEADECGAMNDWLAVAPDATVVQGMVGCMVSIGDVADRPPRPLQDGEVLDIGGHRMRWIDTPHVPHAWEAGVMFDETTRTLFCGDLFTQFGSYEPTTDEDVSKGAIADPDSSYYSLHPSSGAVVRKLADLDVKTLALMHGPTYSGDCKASLRALADDLDKRVAASA